MKNSIQLSSLPDITPDDPEFLKFEQHLAELCFDHAVWWWMSMLWRQLFTERPDKEQLATSFKVSVISIEEMISTRMGCEITLYQSRMGCDGNDVFDFEVEADDIVSSITEYGPDQVQDLLQKRRLCHQDRMVSQIKPVAERARALAQEALDALRNQSTALLGSALLVPALKWEKNFEDSVAESIRKHFDEVLKKKIESVIDIPAQAHLKSISADDVAVRFDATMVQYVDDFKKACCQLLDDVMPRLVEILGAMDKKAMESQDDKARKKKTDQNKTGKKKNKNKGKNNIDKKTDKSKTDEPNSELESAVASVRWHLFKLREEWLQKLFELADEIHVRARSGEVPVTSSRLRHLDRILNQLMVVTLMNGTDISDSRQRGRSRLCPMADLC